MFDIAFSELVIIAVVALVVIGPERLPTVARTVGALLGRLNRYVSDVKADVEREMRLEEMKKLRAEVEQQALGIEQSVVRELESTQLASAQTTTEVGQSLSEVMRETGQVGVEVQQSLAATASSDTMAANVSDRESEAFRDDAALQKIDANATLQTESSAATAPVTDTPAKA